MERFRLRILNQPKRGDVWELKLFPDRPDHLTREADGRVLGTCTNPEAIYWLRQIAAPLLGRALDPAPIAAGPLPPVVGSAARPHPAADSFSARSDPRWLHPEDGMRLALAFSAAKYLATAEQRGRFQEGLAELPSEVILYWFTLCFYGYRQAAGKAALRELLTHEEPPRRDLGGTDGRKLRAKPSEAPPLFGSSEVREGLTHYAETSREGRPRRT